MKSNPTANKEPEKVENDFLDLVVATAISTIGLMGIFVVFTIIELIIR